ncbi:MAG: hypothetical protein LRY66_15595 [Saccharospirillaceae bacterium]|nr:hypothetical protein [Saccharospirillaceae bacterium]MCD8532730.1 hypothetical protein [Saccharospirillaceae bacterium]
MSAARPQHRFSPSAEAGSGTANPELTIRCVTASIVPVATTLPTMAGLVTDFVHDNARQQRSDTAEGQGKEG